MTRPKEKPPAFQFYPRDWLGSEAVGVMTPAQEGAYIRLLCYAWLSGEARLENNPEKLARLARLSPDEWNQFEPVFREVFISRAEDGDDCAFVYQPRLLAELQKQRDYSASQATRGVKSGKARRYKTNQRSRSVQPNGNQTGTKTNSSSSSSSSSSECISPNGEILTPPPPSGFDSWYAAYPRKVARGSAAKAYVGAVKELVAKGRSPPEVHAFLLQAAIEFAASAAGKCDPQHVPHPATWLNAARYDDDRRDWNQPRGRSGRQLGFSGGPGQVYAGPNSLGEV